MKPHPRPAGSLITALAWVLAIGSIAFAVVNIDFETTGRFDHGQRSHRDRMDLVLASPATSFQSAEKVLYAFRVEAVLGRWMATEAVDDSEPLVAA